MQEAEVAAAERFQDECRWISKCPDSGLGRVGLDTVDAVFGPVDDDDAPPGRDHIAVPRHFRPIGEFGDETVRDAGNDQGCLVDLAGLAADVTDKREGSTAGACRPARCPVEGVFEEPQKSVFEAVDVDLRESVRRSIRVASVGIGDGQVELA